MKNVDKKYTPPLSPPLCLSLTQFLHFVVNALAAKRKTICSHLSCWAGSAARDGDGDGEGEKEREKATKICM